MDEKDMQAYKILKPILGFLYKIWYNPKIIGKENIPSNGPFVIVGNHIHIMDQCNVIISTKRPIHYMAKKEYFESKFAWFFRAVGCIPVDRSKKDEEATTSALEVLKNGKVLGLFPEGTRNKLKEERIKELYDLYEDDLTFEDFIKKVKNNKTSQINYLEELLTNKVITKEEFLDNLKDADDFLKDLVLNHRLTKEEYYEHFLLPFKFGAVSLASKTESYIVPFVITGKYKFRSKDLTINIGKPFQPESDLEKANFHLREEMKNLIKENLQK